MCHYLSKSGASSDCVFIEQDWCDGPMKQLLEDKDKRANSQAIKECFQDMFRNLLDSRPRAGSGSQTQGNEFGPFRKKFAQVSGKMISFII